MVMRKVSFRVVALLALSMAAQVVQADPVEGPSQRVDEVNRYTIRVD
jgi:hypothetical protein